MADRTKEPARNSFAHITDTFVRAMEAVDRRVLTRCVIIAMNDDGKERLLFSNARSEPEMFGMISMAEESWTDDIEIDDDESEV